MVRALAEHQVDRPQLQAPRGAQASGTNSPSSSPRLSRTVAHAKSCAHAGPRTPARKGARRWERRERPARARPRRRGSPGPIPNPAVKPAIAESTAAPGCGRPGRRARAGRFRTPRERREAAFGRPSPFPGPARRPIRPPHPPPPPLRGAFLFAGQSACTPHSRDTYNMKITLSSERRGALLFWFAHFSTLRIPSSAQFLRAEILALVGQIFISSIMRRAVRRLAASACSIGLGETFLRRQSCDAILTFRAQFMMLRMQN